MRGVIIGKSKSAGKNKDKQSKYHKRLTNE